MRLEHHLVGGYVRYISPYIIIIITLSFQKPTPQLLSHSQPLKCHLTFQLVFVQRGNRASGSRFNVSV